MTFRGNCRRKYSPCDGAELRAHHFLIATGTNANALGIFFAVFPPGLFPFIRVFPFEAREDALGQREA